MFMRIRTAIMIMRPVTTYNQTIMDTPHQTILRFHINHFIGVVPIIIMKEKLLLMCTCTWLEICTAVGVTAYLMYLQNYMLAAIAASVFAPLIGFHFILDTISKRESCGL
jgi:hypothetical protein